MVYSTNEDGTINYEGNKVFDPIENIQATIGSSSESATGSINFMNKSTGRTSRMSIITSTKRR